ncbi:MAG: hydroxyacid dehydrogenase [Deltaproteobacteria bacterium]|nr:hydroxyacid dehydrogenase [Deltaproteobacteria bacterium]MBW2305928.1 hydroxyacid dehydrogenase [Deltaproteobacteria bacterium]
MANKILVTEDIVGPGIQRLVDKYDVTRDKDLWKDPQRLLESVGSFDALVVRNQTAVNSEVLAAAAQCKVIGRAGVGVDNIDVEAASNHGIVVTFAPDENAISVAEHVMGVMLCIARKLPAADESVKQGRWERMRYLGTELYGKTLGVLGLGKIGCRVALRAKSFGLHIIAYDPYLTRHHLNVTETGAELVDLDTLLARSDFITVHLPLTEETMHLLNESRLSGMKPTAILINTSRGPVVDEKDLYKVLKERRIGGAALDVREKEPPGDSPLHELDNILLTPHVAGFTREAQDKVTDSVGEDVDRVLSGLPALRFVNFSLPRRH